MSDLIQKSSVGTDLAHRMIAAAEAKASEIGVPMVIAVCDESGVLKAFSRMDGAALLSVQIAQDKAHTAAGFGMPTDAWHEFIKDDPPLAAGAVGGIDRLVVFGGGYPVIVDETTVGAIGVSGGHYSQDMEVAQAGLAVLGQGRDGGCRIPARSVRAIGIASRAPNSPCVQHAWRNAHDSVRQARRHPGTPEAAGPQFTTRRPRRSPCPLVLAVVDGGPARAR